MKTLKLSAGLGAVLVLAGCVSMPTGPSVMALPGSGKNFDQFRVDDLDCRQYASSQVGSPDDASANSGVKSAVIGTAIGAVAGAAIGGRSGAATGAGVGLIGGSVAGAGAANQSRYGSQRMYDQSYVQCMYAKGNRVPTNGRFESSRPVTRYAPPPPPPGASAPYYSSTPPPPPAGTPPPPPPDAR